MEPQPDPFHADADGAHGAIGDCAGDAGEVQYRGRISAERTRQRRFRQHRQTLRVPLKIQSSPKCKARKKFRRAAYGLYVSKKYFTQRSITSHLVAVFWRPSGMAITNDLPSVFCWVSQMASSHISSSISWGEIWILRGTHDYQSHYFRRRRHTGRHRRRTPQVVQ